MATETQDKFMGAVSPHCIIHDDIRRQAVRQCVTDYAHEQGLPEAIGWATLRAMNALDAGESAHRAIKVGEAAVDEWPEFLRNHAPITTAWKAAQEMGLADIHCTATGVAGRKRYGSAWVRVAVDLEGV